VFFEATGRTAADLRGGIVSHETTINVDVDIDTYRCTLLEDQDKRSREVKDSNREELKAKYDRIFSPKTPC
jgi:hypothetical protein